MLAFKLVLFPMMPFTTDVAYLLLPRLNRSAQWRTVEELVEVREKISQNDNSLLLLQLSPSWLVEYHGRVFRLHKLQQDSA